MTVAADPRIGTELAGYRIEALLGRGGMSDVYLAQDLRLKRKVALKLLAPDLARDERFRERFLRESELAASIDHPNITPVYEAGEVEGLLYIAMRYVEGSDLKSVLAKDGRLEPRHAVAVLDQVADALDVAHERGLVHRDVKPGNILIATPREGREHVYLTDFGLTKHTAEEGSLTDSGQFLGTIDYVAPEQIEGGEIDGRTDMYSLGCVLYECLAGRVPFSGASKVGLLFAHLQKPPPSLIEHRPELPNAIDDVIAKAMAKSPADRYQTCRDLLEEARSALGLSGEFVRPSVPAERPSRFSRRRLTLFAVLVVVVAVAASVLAFVFTDGDAQVGDTWTRVSSQALIGGPRSLYISAVTAGPAGFVAVGRDESGGDTDGAVWTSPDGVSWERVRDSGGDLGGKGDQLIEDVIAGGPGFVAVGRDQIGEDTDAAVWTSPDGVSWARVPHKAATFGEPHSPGQPPDRWMYGVTVGGPGLVAAGGEGQVPSSQPNEGENYGIDAAVWTSVDGISWTRVTDEAAFGVPNLPEESNRAMMAVTAGKHGFVAVGWEDQSESFDAAIWTSPDGLKWTRVPADDTADAESSRAFVLLDVIPVEEGFVAVGAEVSVDPHNGMVHVPPEPGGGLPDGMALFAGPLMFDTSGAILTSSDGSRWSRVGDEELARPEARTAQFNAVAAGGPGLVAVGWGTQRDPHVAAVWTSKDGLRWSPAADPAGALHGPRGLLMTDVVARDSGLIAVGADGTPFAVDGAVWTSP